MYQVLLQVSHLQRLTVTLTHDICNVPGPYYKYHIYRDWHLHVIFVMYQALTTSTIFTCDTCDVPGPYFTMFTETDTYNYMWYLWCTRALLQVLCLQRLTLTLDMVFVMYQLPTTSTTSTETDTYVRHGLCDVPGPYYKYYVFRDWHLR